MNFIHMSDTHLRVTPLTAASDFPAEKIIDDGRRLRAALRRAKAHSPSPDFFVISGDLVRYGLTRMIQEGDIRAVLTGHAHFTRFGAVNGVLYATAAGTAFCIDPTDAESMVFLGASSYLYGQVRCSPQMIYRRIKLCL
ncbi:MAG: hypothetical protein LBL37_07785 [Gracilibacteraceae bacterium]|jgi:2',3'-cyclic-nucleotide 2'-phosphodiesterase (5'-nucleotidase family)|nr:hypothetical protein [Gracilibacteraceae bacterium]